MIVIMGLFDVNLLTVPPFLKRSTSLIADRLGRAGAVFYSEIAKRMKAEKTARPLVPGARGRMGAMGYLARMHGSATDVLQKADANAAHLVYQITIPNDALGVCKRKTKCKNAPRAKQHVTKTFLFLF